MSDDTIGGMSEFAEDMYQICIRRGDSPEVAKRNAHRMERIVTEALREEATEENTVPRRRRHLERRELTEEERKEAAKRFDAYADEIVKGAPQLMRALEEYDRTGDEDHARNILKGDTHEH